MKTATKTIKINEEELLDRIETALRQMNRHSMSGWGIAIEIDNDELCSTDIISDSTYSGGDEIEILRIRTWEDELQNSVLAWYNDNLDVELKKELDAFFDEHEIDESTYKIDDLIEMGLPEKLQEDYNNYQDIVIDDAIDRMRDHYRFNEIPYRIDMINAQQDKVEVELV